MSDQIPRTQFRQLRKNPGLANPSDSWTAPEHSKVNECRRLRFDVMGDKGEVVIPKGTLMLPEPQVLRQQRETERKLRQ